MTLLSLSVCFPALSSDAQAQKPKKIHRSKAFPESSGELYADDPWYNLKLSAEQEMEVLSEGNHCAENNTYHDGGAH